MFQSIRQGQQFFILHKGENPRCDVGTVVSVSNPVPKYQNGYTAYPLPQNEMVVDVKVKVGDDTLDFQKLPANLSIADFSQVGGNFLHQKEVRESHRIYVNSLSFVHFHPIHLHHEQSIFLSYHFHFF